MEFFHKTSSSMNNVTIHSFFILIELFNKDNQFFNNTSNNFLPLSGELK